MTSERDAGMKKVLNVGGNSKAIPLPPVYDGWEHVLLDIDPKGRPDVLCDARDMLGLPGSEYDAVYCSHNLEHFFQHDVRKVLLGFLHVMKPDGFAHVVVPDVEGVMRAAVQRNLDITDILGHSQAGPIKVRDVIYGLESQIERSGQDYFAHRTGFSAKSLASALEAAGLSHVFVGANGDKFEITAFAFRSEPSEENCRLLKLVDPGDQGPGRPS
jgi:hypothetical protein